MAADAIRADASWEDFYLFQAELERYDALAQALTPDELFVLLAVACPDYWYHAQGFAVFVAVLPEWQEIALRLSQRTPALLAPIASPRPPTPAYALTPAGRHVIHALLLSLYVDRQLSERKRARHA